ncbi:MAG: hypothetical protein A2V88_00670 [Elusimicrobia bacterium RBG_16_66_12]|nr:MAG: hypothetical protein A2V88_00670 [Elusimicrobia bacterium RBG_16_66_12]
MLAALTGAGLQASVEDFPLEIPTGSAHVLLSTGEERPAEAFASMGNFEHARELVIALSIRALASGGAALGIAESTARAATEALFADPSLGQRGKYLTLGTVGEDLSRVLQAGARQIELRFSFTYAVNPASMTAFLEI